MKKNNDAFKKHHFWILAAAAPLLVFLALIFLLTGVSSDISAKQTATEAKASKIKSANAPGVGVLADIKKKKVALEAKKLKLWEENWLMQSEKFNLFTWPKVPGNLFAGYETKKFGEPLKEFDETAAERFREKNAYQILFQQASDNILPTRIVGGWQSGLRWVSAWGEKKPSSNQIWLLMEDLWIQRAMLEPIRVVNESITQFELVPGSSGSQPPPLNRKFQNRIWEIELEVKNGPNNSGKILAGKLRNRTKHLELIGLNNVMMLRVWLDPKLDLPPVEFQVQGELVPGEETMTIPPLPTHLIPPGTAIVAIAKVEQVLDTRTVPVRELTRLALTYPSAKYNYVELKPPTFWPDAAAAAAGAAVPGGPTPGMDVGTDGLSSAGSSGIGSLPGALGPQVVPKGAVGGMPLLAAADGTKKRYVEVTGQLRRMSVAFSVIVDQAYINDVLIAYANSPLRFETVQYHWRRATVSSSGSTPSPSVTPGTPGNLPPGAMMSSGGSSGGSSGRREDENGELIGGSASGGLSGSFSFGSGGPPGMMGMSGPYGGIPGLTANTLSAVSEAQANSGLVELTVYGLITIYEKYEPVKKDTDPTAAPTTPEEPPATPATPGTIPPATPATPATPGTTPPATGVAPAPPAAGGATVPPPVAGTTPPAATGTPPAPAAGTTPPPATTPPKN